MGLLLAHEFVSETNVHRLRDVYHIGIFVSISPELTSGTWRLTRHRTGRIHRLRRPSRSMLWRTWILNSLSLIVLVQLIAVASRLEAVVNP